MIKKWLDDLQLNCTLTISEEFRPDNHLVIKKWLDDLQLNCTLTIALEDYMKVEYSLNKEIYNLIKKARFLEQLQIDEN